MIKVVTKEGGDLEALGFGAGAVVALKSGGMPMTVRDQARGAVSLSVNCDWITPDGAPYQATFPVAMLMRAVPLPVDNGAETDEEAP